MEKSYWKAKCPVCGWKGLSGDCEVFVKEGGSYQAVLCPVCFKGDFWIIVKEDESGSGETGDVAKDIREEGAGPGEVRPRCLSGWLSGCGTGGSRTQRPPRIIRGRRDPEGNSNHSNIRVRGYRGTGGCMQNKLIDYLRTCGIYEGD